MTILKHNLTAFTCIPFLDPADTALALLLLLFMSACLLTVCMLSQTLKEPQQVDAGDDLLFYPS